MAWENDMEERVQRATDAILRAADRAVYPQALYAHAARAAESRATGDGYVPACGGEPPRLPDLESAGRAFRREVEEILRQLAGITPAAAGPLRAISRVAPVAWAILEETDPAPYAGLGGDEFLVLHAVAHAGAETAFGTLGEEYAAWRSLWATGAWCGALRFHAGRLVERQRFIRPLPANLPGRRQPWHVPLDALHDVRRAIHRSRDHLARLVHGGA